MQNPPHNFGMIKLQHDSILTSKMRRAACVFALCMTFVRVDHVPPVQPPHPYVLAIGAGIPQAL